MPTYLKVDVEESPALFAWERAVTFHVFGRRIHLLVDVSSLDGDLLEVKPLAFDLETDPSPCVLVQLPRDSFQHGSRVIVPLDALLSQR